MGIELPSNNTLASDRDYCLLCGALIGYEGDLLCASCQSNQELPDDEQTEQC